MNEEQQDIRWIQRCNNFSRAFNLLRQILEEESDMLTLKPIVKEGIIKRFQYTFELAWKTLKDKMEYDGLRIEKTSPKYVFKLAYQSKYITDIDLWLAMINDKNLMSHTYNFETFDKVLLSLQKDYYPLFNNLYIYFIEEQVQ